MSKSVFIKILLLAVLALVFACEKEVDQPSPAQEVQTVHYKATVQTGVDTRATIGEDMKYKFEEGDRVYMESTDGKLYGFLSLSVEGGQGKNVALFEGDLNYVGETPIPDDYNPEMKLVLVSKEDELHTITDGKVDAVTSASYLANKWAPSLEDAVSHLSHFTGTGHFNDVRLTLNQQSGFLKCFVEMKPQHAGHEVTAKLLNDGQPFREAIVTVSETGSLPFVFAYLGGQVTLKSAKLVVEYNNTTLGSFDVSDKKLAANNSYSISRSTIEFDGFRIKAAYDNTSITFNYTGIEYSLDYGDTWEQYPGDNPQISLQAEEVVFVKGSRTQYNDNGPIFTTGNSSQLCYISGNITSLLTDGNLVASAFQGAFSMGTTPINYIDINPDAPLILPATIASSCYYQMFRNCTSLTKAPELPATESAASCYYAMFEGCTSLVMPPSSIPFTTVAKSACSKMFYGCTSLTSAPEFSSSMEEVKESGCADMFNGCTKLVTVPSSLPATKLGTSCYQQMFRNCTSLTTAPDLPATASASSCYRSMFEECTALKTPPSSIPFVTVESSACRRMFYDCTSLTSSPGFPSLEEVKGDGCADMFYGCKKLKTPPSSLPATKLGTSCYSQMFLGCTSLTAAPELPATASAESCYKSMFQGCTALATAPSSIPFETVVEKYACYRMFYGCTTLTSAPSFSNTLSAINEFGCTEMFFNCTKLTSAPNFSNTLTEIKNSGCAGMFYNCTSLVTPPSSLPAKTLGFKAYYRMFFTCSKLESIPDFPHETGVEYVLTAGTSAENGKQDGLCYQMFYKCDALTSLEGKQLFNSDTPLKLGCFNDMFSTCANLQKVPEDFLPATTLAPSCYRGMFQSCKNLIKAPYLLAENLESKCYQYMFNSCTSLIYIKCLSKTPGSADYTQNWLQKAKNAAECTFHYRPGVEWPRNEHGIPNQWTITDGTGE